MTSWTGADEHDDAELPEDWLDYCDRCGGVIVDGRGASATVQIGASDDLQWSWCDECIDSFTAWRLTPERDSQPERQMPETPF